MKELTKIEEILLLSIWRLKDQAYGFKIRHHVSEIIGKDFTYGNLYSILNQLTKKKYVNKHKGENTPSRQGKIRMYYTLSDAGRDALKYSYEMNKKLWDGVSAFAFNTNKK
ncbi:helix-turn-helix transcriptional regulator [Acidobacteriota bacterium]